MSDVTRVGPVPANSGSVFVAEISSDTVRSLVTLSGELDVASAPNLQQILDQLCRDGYPEIVLDLSGLQFVSAAGLTVFLCADEQLGNTGGRLILNRPGRRIRRVLAITELDTVLTIRETACTLDQPTTNGIGEVFHQRTQHQRTPAAVNQPASRSTGAHAMPTAWEPG